MRALSIYELFRRPGVALGLTAALLGGCGSQEFSDFMNRGSTPRLQPEPASPSPAGRTGSISGGRVHVVSPGDTVYSISRRYGSTPTAVQAANGLDPSFTIQPGQRLTIPTYRAPPPPSAVDRLPPAPPPTPELASPNLGAAQTGGPARPLERPVSGEIVTPFGSSLGGASNDGVDIAARPGTSVVAADEGEVAFVSEEDGPVGSVMLLQHPGGLVTIYGRIANLAVSQGDRVRKGQKIAEVAQGRAGETSRLHFELRRGSRPIDPTPYL
ncbi:MAG: peptidoglycan DD-metalloendopeptidase family protein [Pseudomonadota bacterium]